MRISLLFSLMTIFITSSFAQTVEVKESFNIAKMKMTDDVTRLLEADEALVKLTSVSDFDSTITYIGLMNEKGRLIEHLTFGDSAATLIESRISEILIPFEFMNSQGQNKFLSKRIMMTIQPIGKHKFAVSLQ